MNISNGYFFQHLVGTSSTTLRCHSHEKIICNEEDSYTDKLNYSLKYFYDNHETAGKTYVFEDNVSHASV